LKSHKKIKYGFYFDGEKEMTETRMLVADKIKEFERKLEIVTKELSEIKRNGFGIKSGKTLESFERELHKKHSELADLETAKKLQELLFSGELNKEAKELAKSHPKKNKR